MECYICALSSEDEAKPPFARVAGPRRTVEVCEEHYSTVVWASMPSPRITRLAVAR